MVPGQIVAMTSDEYPYLAQLSVSETACGSRPTKPATTEYRQSISGPSWTRRRRWRD